MRVFVTGGAGYVGHVLVPRLLKAGHKVTVYDTLWYGCRLPNVGSLTVIKGDIRDTRLLCESIQKQDVVIHLACISNDSSFELDPKLSREINYEVFPELVQEAKMAGVYRFIYASTSSVYGISNELNVTEEHAKVPLTDYNKYKGLCEPILFDFMSNRFICTILRPATLCGYSPRMRLDLSVNALTINACVNRVIRVFGGSQMRPNLHIEDMVRAYDHVMNQPANLVQGEIFNVGDENLSILEIARTVRDDLGDNIEIKVEPSSDDQRSYHVSSQKIKDKLGFIPLFTIHNAIYDIELAYKNYLLCNTFSDDSYYNVRTMKKYGVS